jgi:hypothetical protein
MMNMFFMKKYWNIQQDIDSLNEKFGSWKNQTDSIDARCLVYRRRTIDSTLKLKKEKLLRALQRQYHKIYS